MPNYNYLAFIFAFDEFQPFNAHPITNWNNLNVSPDCEIIVSETMEDLENQYNEIMDVSLYYDKLDCAE